MAKKCEILLGVGIFLAVVGASLIVAFGIQFLKPFLEVQTLVEGKCYVDSSTLYPISEYIVTCDCGKDSAASDCTSQYQCLKIWVNFTSVYGENAYNITLFDSYETFLLQGPTKKQCSYHKCDRLSSRNDIAVRAFHASHGSVGEDYTCYYEPASPTYAVLHIVTLWTAVHTILWPSLAFIIGSSIVISYIFCTKPDPQNRHNYPSSSLDRVKNINRDNGYERVLTA